MRAGMVQRVLFGSIVLILVGLAAGWVSQAAAQAATEAPTPIVQSTEDLLLATAEPTPSAAEDSQLAARDVTIQADSAHAVTLVIPYEGGTMTTTGSDGTKYTLTFAKGSVLLDTQISMTPFESVTKNGTTYPSIGVELGPNGLQLYEPATLLIEPAQPIPVKQQVSFSFEGQGSGAYRYPLDIDPSKILFHLYHFSGAGLIGATTDAVNGLFSSTLSDGTATEQQQDSEKIAQLADEARNGVISEADFFSQVQAIMDQYAQDVLQPMVDALNSNPNPSESDVYNTSGPVFSFLREYALLTDETSIENSKWGKMYDAIINAITRLAKAAQKDCGTPPRQIFYDSRIGWLTNPDRVTQLLNIARTVELLGIPGFGGLNDWLEKCRPNGFKFSGLTLDQTAQGGQLDLKMVIGMEECGSDPYQNEWMADGWTNVATFGGIAKSTVTRGVGGKLNANGPTVVPQIGLTFFLDPRNPPVMRASGAINGYTASGPEQALITEATDCPPAS